MATIKHKRAFEKVVKGSSLAKAMREVGYAKSTAKRTNKLTNTKGWQELMDKFISEEKLAKVHAEGLEAGKTIYKNNVTSGEIEEVGFEPDYAVRHKYLETGYKVRKKLSDKQEGNKTLVLVVSGETANRYGVTPDTETSSIRPA